MEGDGEKSRKQRRRDFWRAWHRERRRLWQHHDPGDETAGFRPPFPPAEIAHAWREFFHEFMGAWPEEHWAFGGRRFSSWHQGIDSFNPFVANLLSKGGGLLPLLVLQQLSKKPHYGNELMEQISKETGGQWEANPGAIYPLMTELEDLGLVQGEWEDPHKRTIRVYKLTDAGAQELARLKAVVRPKLEEAIQVLQKLAASLNGGSAASDEDYI